LPGSLGRNGQQARSRRRQVAITVVIGTKRIEVLASKDIVKLEAFEDHIARTTEPDRIDSDDEILAAGIHPRGLLHHGQPCDPFQPLTVPLNDSATTTQFLRNAIEY